MAHNRLPRGSRYEPDRDVGDVILFHDRLVELQERLLSLADPFGYTEPGVTKEQKQARTDEYRDLASFTGYLANMANRTHVEVTQTVAVMRKEPPLNQAFKKYLDEEMDKSLIAEINKLPPDTDKISLAAQTEAFCEAIRSSYKGRDR